MGGIINVEVRVIEVRVEKTQKLNPIIFYTADFRPKIINVARKTIKNKHRRLKIQIHELTASQ